MQILCGLQVVFFLFNCQTPVQKPPQYGSKVLVNGKILDKTCVPSYNENQCKRQ